MLPLSSWSRNMSSKVAGGKENLVSFLLHTPTLKKETKCPSGTSGVFQLAITQNRGRGSVVVKALCYKPESRGFSTR
jgi:hypothetical protein